MSRIGCDIGRDIEATGLFSSKKLVDMGLSPFTADCAIDRETQRVMNGAYSKAHLVRGDYPSWSEGRLLSLLTTSDNFYWTLYRADGRGKFHLTVFADGREYNFNQDRLIDVAFSAILLCINTGNLLREYMGTAVAETIGAAIDGRLKDIDSYAAAPIIPMALEGIFMSDLRDAVSSGSMTITDAFQKGIL